MLKRMRKPNWVAMLDVSSFATMYGIAYGASFNIHYKERKKVQLDMYSLSSSPLVQIFPGITYMSASSMILRVSELAMKYVTDVLVNVTTSMEPRSHEVREVIYQAPESPEEVFKEGIKIVYDISTIPGTKQEITVETFSISMAPGPSPTSHRTAYPQPPTMLI
jgi:hypothetical protein